MRANSRFTYELIVWVCCLELTLHVRAATMQEALRRVRSELGPNALVVNEPKLFRGSTSQPCEPAAPTYAA